MRLKKWTDIVQISFAKKQPPTILNSRGLLIVDRIKILYYCFTHFITETPSLL